MRLRSSRRTPDTLHVSSRLPREAAQRRWTAQVPTGANPPCNHQLCDLGKSPNLSELQQQHGTLYHPSLGGVAEMMPVMCVPSWQALNQQSLVSHDCMTPSGYHCLLSATEEVTLGDTRQLVPRYRRQRCGLLRRQRWGLEPSSSGLRAALLATPWACKGHRGTEAADVPSTLGKPQVTRTKELSGPGSLDCPLPDFGSSLGILEDKA